MLYARPAQPSARDTVFCYRGDAAREKTSLALSLAKGRQDFEVTLKTYDPLIDWHD